MTDDEYYGAPRAKTVQQEAAQTVAYQHLNVELARNGRDDAKKRLGKKVTGILKIVADLTGVTAAVDCVHGDMGGCGETALNLLGSLVGGVAGRILERFGAPWNWAKGAKLAKKLWNLVADSFKAFQDIKKGARALKGAEEAERGAIEAMHAVDAEQAGTVALKGTNAKGLVNSRGSFRKQPLQDAWDSAKPGAEGGRLCPSCGAEVKVAPNSGAARDWHASHNPSWTNREFDAGVSRPRSVTITTLVCPWSAALVT